MAEKIIDIEQLAQDLRAPFTQGGGLRRGCGIEIDVNLLPDMIEPYGIDLNLLPDFSDLLPDMIEPLEVNPKEYCY